MTPDPNLTNPPTTPPDDERLAAMVRATADGWALPPQRLDQPTWRDRVKTRSGQRRRGWLHRVAAPAATAVVATIVLAFAAVWLTTPRTGPVAGASQSPATATSGASPAPSSQPLPAVVLNGDLPDPSSVVVLVGEGYRLADLATGMTTPMFPRARIGPGGAVIARPGGGWLCVCGAWTGSSGGRPTAIDIAIVPADTSGPTGSASVVRSVRGRADPGSSLAGQPELADMRATGSPDGRFAFVTWSARDGANGWTAGLDVVDLATATVVSSTPLPMTEPQAATGQPTTRIAPEVDLSPAGDRIIVSSFWYVATDSANVSTGIDHWTAPFASGTIGSLAPAGSTIGSGCNESDRGLVDDSTIWVLCATPSGATVVRRTHLDGMAIDSIPNAGGSFSGGTYVSRHGDGLYLWDAGRVQLTRLDLQTGEVTSTTGTAAASPAGGGEALAAVGRALGRWIAPPAMAKVFIDPAIVVSPDGKRVYAIGVDRLGGDTIASSGVFVFDAGTVEQVGHWAPTADFVSLTISPDGRFVYAAGDANRTPDGATSPDAASITVYDTTDGSVRLSAGKLGFETLLFTGPVIR